MEFRGSVGGEKRKKKNILCSIIEPATGQLPFRFYSTPEKLLSQQDPLACLAAIKQSQ